MKKFIILMICLLSVATHRAQSFDQESAYNNLYAMMRQSWFNDAAIQNADLVRGLFTANELTSDEAYCIWSDAGVPEYNQATPTPSNILVRDLWATLFYQINCCNAFLENATGEDAVTQKERAEARVLRALLYTYAIDFWGDVPLWLSTEKTATERTARAEVFRFIENELKAVESDLDAPSDGVYGHVNKGVVQLLLARLYLNAEVYTGTARWAEAKQQAQVLINSDWYSLAADYSFLFMADNNTNGAQHEIVFPIIIDSSMADNWGNTTYLIAASQSSFMDYDLGFDNKWDGLTVRGELQRLFLNGDARNLFYGDRCVKYTNLRSDGLNPTSRIKVDTDFPLMRLSEAYLIYAEADARMNGGTCSADGLQMLNVVRQRAQASALNTASLSDLVAEWGREFYFEAVRRPTLIRFGLYSSNAYRWEGRGDDVLDLFPLPADIVAAYGLTQNAGYEDFTYQPSELLMNEPLFGTKVIDLTRFEAVQFSWERPADATTKLTYMLQLSLTSDFSTRIELLLNTYYEYAEVTTTMLYNALSDLGVEANNELTAYVRVYVHGKASNVVSIRLKNTKPAAYSLYNMWCLTGNMIASESWTNDNLKVGLGMIPLFISPDNPNEYTYTGYFASGSFKIVQNYSWNYQFGYGILDSDSWIQYGDGENISVTTPGYYSITIFENRQSASVSRYEQPVESYSAIGLSGDFNGWDAAATPMNPVSTNENHDWCVVVTFDSDTHLKFEAKGSSSVIWGGGTLPYGHATVNGEGISVKAGTYKVIFNDITGYYLFLNPNTGYPSEDQNIIDGHYINKDYATIEATEADPIKVSEIGGRVQVVQLPVDADYSELTLIVNNGQIPVSIDGTIDVWDAKQFYEGKMASTIDVKAKLRGYVTKDGLKVYTESPVFTISFLLEAQPISSNYYYIGSQTDWGGTPAMPLTKVSDRVFRLVWQVPANIDEWFKFAPEESLAGPDWNNMVCPENNGESVGIGMFVIGDNGAWKIDANPEEKTYSMTLDFNRGTYTLLECNTTGDVNGDGKVNTEDIVELLNYMIGKPSGVFIQKNADANHDGSINTADMISIVNIILGE